MAERSARPGWPRGRALHGGVDEIPLPEGPGRLWLCGKQFVGPDPEKALAEAGADRVVCLCERQELVDRFPAYVSWLTAHTGDGEVGAIWFPIPDLHAPGLATVRPFLERLRAGVAAGHGFLVHCGAGIGRAGTMAAALLMTMGSDRISAVATVARHRPMAGPEAGSQEDLLIQLESSLHP
jgi:protein-tyrosine phosphatase